MRIKNWKEFSDSLIQQKIPFEVKKTSMTIKFFTRYGDFEFTTVDENSLPQSELFFIKKVKDYCENLNLNFEVDRSQIKYIHLPRFVAGRRFENFYEIDLSSAYWNFAYKEGILSESIYKQGKDGYINSRGEFRTISKRTRLASLGALAKLTQHLIFDGEKWHVGKLDESPKANYFFRVAEMTGEVMQQLQILLREGFILFWVDAVFLDKDYLQIVENYLTEKNLPYKKYFCERAESCDTYLRVYSEQHKKEKETEKNYRDFFFKNQTEKFDLFQKQTKKQKHNELHRTNDSKNGERNNSDFGSN